MKNYRGIIAFAVVLVLCAGAALFEKTEKPTIIEYNEFIHMLQAGKVKSVTLSENQNMQLTLSDDDLVYETTNPRSSGLKEELLLGGVEVIEGSYTSTTSLTQSAFGVAFFVGAGFLAFKMMNRQNGKGVMSMQLSDSSSVQSGISFSDIAGNEEAKDSVSDIIEFIKNPDKYSSFGARMPRGIVLYGAPGTGKTLMAKAIAGEAGVPFYAVSGSDFVQMYVGVGAGRIRELFQTARKKGKAVIFIDEIDALGKKRSSQAAGGNDERDQTLNALLTEMSGFGSTDGIVVIAATNRLDTLDEALLRPGRFDRLIEISLPDYQSRKCILALYALEKPLAEDVNLDSLAKQCVYFSGAMLENLMNEAAISAANDGNAEQITKQHIDKAYYTIIAGSEKKDRSGIRPQERKITAYHEAGHALMTKLKSPENSVTKITIIPSTKGAGGFCVNIPLDKMYYTKNEILAQLMINLAGRASEELVFGDGNITTGASNDIEKANSLVNDFISKYGMSDKLGLCGGKANERAVLEESRSIIEKLYHDTLKLLSENRSLLDKLTERLLEKETLCEEELDEIIYCH